ncbi:MAG: CDP-alcohol phosphatidyltransferase family protein [Candidatus Woesearchaeota archaeon]
MKQWNLPNLLTLFRLLIIAPMFLFGVAQNQIAVGFCFLLAGLSDFLDGFLARLLNKESEFGAWFDSVVDNLVLVAGFVVILVLQGVSDLLISKYGYVVLIGVAIYLAKMFVSYAKYRKPVFFHLISNKLGAFSWFFTMVYGLFFGLGNAVFGFLINLTLVVNIYCTAEEILILLRFREFNSSTKSIFELK